MTYTSCRGIAGENAAVREAQREAALKLEQEASRRRPGFGRSESSASTDSAASEKEDWSLPQFNVLGHERADALPLKMEKCLDMALIKKGSFFFMSTKYTDVEDWTQFVDAQETATF